MLQIALIPFLVLTTAFAAVMIHEPRSLWSGFTFFSALLSLGLFSLIAAAYFSSAIPRAVVWLLVVLAIIAGLFLLAFPLLLLMIFIVEGIKVVRHEGLSPSNLLSLLFAVLWAGFLFVWPMAGTWARDPLGSALYIVLSFAAVYLLALMAMYVLSALLNLFHFHHARRLNYIIVLGAGLLGDKVPPLLASRIDRGIALLSRNPGAALIMSGGQGPGEDLPEGRAMARYAIDKGVDPARILVDDRSANTEENLRFSMDIIAAHSQNSRPRIALVTTAYHVFRALILAKKLGVRCVGYGAKTRWYFTLNAILREFAGYLSLTRRRHLLVVGGAAALMLGAYLLTVIF